MTMPLSHSAPSVSVHATALIEFIKDYPTKDIPPIAFDNARACLLDALGCGLFGASQPWSTIMASQLIEESSHGSSVVLGHRQTLSAPAAALCNGTAIHGFELDDLLPAAIIHPGTVVIPAVLAAAQSSNATAEQLLRAIILGYEATSRLSLALGTKASELGFHKTSVVGPVASALAVGSVLGLTIPQLISAAGIAASLSSGIKAYVVGGGGGMVKRMHAGWAASSAVRAALLAQKGFTGPSGAIEGHYGLLDVFGYKEAQPTALSKDFGQAWAINAVWFKVYPLCGWVQGVVQLIKQLRKASPFNPDELEKIVVGTSQLAVKSNANPKPEDTMDAQYSIPYCVALTLMGDPADPRSFEPASFTDQPLLALAAKVELTVDPECEAVYPSRFGSRVQLHLKNGKVLQALTLDPHGTPADPCTAEEISIKFNRLADLSPLPVDSRAIAKSVLALQGEQSLQSINLLLQGQ